jgi:hypothetical protein
MMNEIDVVINNATKELSVYRMKMRELSSATLQNVCDTFFNVFPEVKTIYWAQWIPGFNDGDPCVFSLGDINFSPAQWDAIEGPYWGDPDYNYNGKDEKNELDNFVKYSSWKNNELATPLQENILSIENFLISINDYLESTFGNNAFVRIHRNGVETEDYDCGY